MATKKGTASAPAGAKASPQRSRFCSGESDRKARATQEHLGRNGPSRVVLTEAAPEDTASANAYREGLEESARLERRKKRIARELDRRGIDPNSPRGRQYGNRFLRPASEVNVALLQVALLELTSPDTVMDIILQLNDSFMHMRVDDEWYFGQDDTKESLADLGVTNYGYLQMHARIYLAGKIAGRDEERRRCCEGRRRE